MTPIEPDVNFRCRLCGRRFSSVTSPVDSTDRLVVCRVCGEYEISARAWSGYAEFTTKPAERHLLSALTRTAPIRGVGRMRIDIDQFVALEEGRVRRRTLIERRRSILNWMAAESRRNRIPYGARVPIVAEADYPVAFCLPPNGELGEWNLIYRPLREQELIDSADNNGRVAITHKGWEEIEARPSTSEPLGFVAMSFAKEMDVVYAAIAKGIERAGYEARRLDREEYIGGVMDEIIATIRKSRFVVADFTGNRGGVYYEAGFAFGHEIPMFALCREDHLDGAERVHFDVQHLNFIPWKEGKLDELTARLEARVVAVLDRGPLDASYGSKVRL